MKKYINGKVYIEKGNFAQAFAVEDGKIKNIGSNEEIKKLPGQEVDLGGKTVLPGLIDSHLHLRTMGETLIQLRLYNSKSIDEVVQRGKDYLKDHEGIQFIYGRGWNQDYFVEGEKRFVNRHDLDKISTEIPIIAERVCVHILSCNTKALEMLGIDENTVIEGGEIYKDENGELLGIFAEKATEILRNIVPEDTKEDIQEKFLAGVNHALANGLTSVQSCDVFMADHWDPIHGAIEELYMEKKVPLRYYPQFNLTDLDKIKDYVEKIYKRDGIYDETYERGAIKLFKDGTLGARTALMSKPYNDDPSTKGIEAMTNEYVDSICAYADQENIRVVTHCIGDEAAKRVVDSYEKINHENNPNRNGLIHLQITDRPLLERIARLNINATYQPIFLEYDIMTVRDRVGDELASTSYAHNTLKNVLGAHTAYSTDAPVEDLNPFPCMYSAVTRQRVNGEPEGGLYPNERVSVEDAIDCYTIEGAYTEGNEKIKGRIQPGYLADFIILDRDIFTIDKMDIKDVKVEETFINGESVYKKN
ncbi:amidohydrolase family protein [Peptoniphilus sp. oral taxon 375 str. F0436]|nr:amidohydrolase family protein [Peptoniphilus sp. oral taxon 375 str. F0436]